MDDHQTEMTESAGFDTRCLGTLPAFPPDGRSTRWSRLCLRIATATVVALSGACATQPPKADTPTVAESDSAKVVRLEREARAIAKIEGCASAQQCVTAALGERPCGGPREYLVYCARTTDTTALNRKLAELRQAEMEWNRKGGAMSTCEFREPPPTTLVSGVCREQPSTGSTGQTRH